MTERVPNFSMLKHRIPLATKCDTSKTLTSTSQAGLTFVRDVSPSSVVDFVPFGHNFVVVAYKDTHVQQKNNGQNYAGK